MTDPGIQLRPMTHDHLPRCAAMVDRVDLFRPYAFTSAAALPLLARALDDGRSDLVVAVAAQELAGFAWLVRRGAFDRSGYLRLIVVAPGFQGRGVGQLMLSNLERRHLKDGGIVLLASGTNPGAHRFYERLGYEPVGILPGYVKPDMDERMFYKPPPAV